MRRVAPLVAVAVLVGAPEPVWSQEAETGWSLTSELTAVWTGGNAVSNTLGFNATLRRLWDRSELKLEAGAIRTESTRKTRRAIGTPGSFSTDEDSDREKTAENFYARAIYRRDLSAAFFLFVGADWLRNTFAGLESRLLLSAGAGNTWVQTDRVSFKTSYGATYTFEEDVVNNPFAAQDFAGARFRYEYTQVLSSTTDFSSSLTGDWNLDRTDDLRFDWHNSIAVSINTWLALKPSLRLQWRNDPALTSVDLFANAGDTTPVGTVLTPLEKLDSFFTLALVVKI